MNATTVKHLLANQITMTHHERHISTPINETIKNNLSHTTICQMQQFNPIQSKWVAAMQMRCV